MNYLTVLEKTQSKNKTLNLHCNTFEINIVNKKNTILLEYNKYMDKFNKLLGIL